jgi:predicted N-acyltransferase
MRAEVAESINDFSARDWNRLAGDRYPFLRHEFLKAAEDSGSAGPQTGWTPRHIGLFDASGRLTAAMPLYEKSHSWGEFVFDWSWAHAYDRAGLDYYPKLVSAVPFTPATSRRLMATDADAAAGLVEAGLEIARAGPYSSLHVLFPEDDELAALEAGGLKMRKDCQFHWHNRDYRTFDDFIATFSSAKRKKVRRDRRRVAEQGITFRRFSGHDIDSAVWRDVYELISLTFMRRGSLPYFSLEFFQAVTEQLPDNMLVIIAGQQATTIAAAVFYDTDTVLYGRYWGADGHYDALHFETCYYQGIDYCIERGRARFEPGTQGEHKISRGFVPVTTWSAHWLARPEFFSAVGQYLEAEGRQIERYVDVVNDHVPYKQTSGE